MHAPVSTERIPPERPVSPAKAMFVLTSLFFMWGFMTVMNDVLVPHWKEVFQLNYTRSLLVQFCFFSAYFIGSLVYFLLSATGTDPIQRVGYKRASVIGLLMSAAACALFLPASYAHSYPAFLGALFMLGLGFTVLQIAANPFVAIIGSAEGASSRLNLAQAFNSLGTTLAPLLGGWLIFERLHGDAVIRYPYAVYTGVFLLLALLIWITRLPEPAAEVRAANANAFRHPQLRWGMLAIFCYVGAEVAIGSLIINFLGSKHVLELPGTSAKHYLSLYWGGAMTGRFLGAIALSRSLRPAQRVLYMLGIGIAMFTLLFALNTSDRFLMKHFWPMGALIVANLVAFLLAGPNPARALSLFAGIAIVLLVTTVVLHGAFALWAIIAIGLFNSILWSNIFTLAIDGLKDDTSQGSSLLVMMIMGGAMVPWIQAVLADVLSTPTDPDAGLSLSFILPAVCYAFLVWYGWRGSRHTSPLVA